MRSEEGLGAEALGPPFPGGWFLPTSPCSVPVAEIFVVVAGGGSVFVFCFLGFL